MQRLRALVADRVLSAPDTWERHLIVAVKGAYDRYCDLPAETFDALMGAPSMGRYFNRNIREASAAAFACRN